MINEKYDNEIETPDVDLAVSWRNANRFIVGVYVFIIIAIFPLYFHNFYFDILKSKYVFYYRTVIIAALVMLITSIIFLWIDARDYQWEHVKKIWQSKNIKSMRICDWTMIAFVVASTISTIQSEYLYESFWGNEGRLMGLFIILLYGVSYFMISRFFLFKKWYLDVFLISGAIACLIGILQYYMIDPIGFNTNVPESIRASYMSTFGNINTYTSYIALITGTSIVLFVIEENVIRRYLYLLSVIISIFALLTGVSDNSYLTLMAVFGLLPLWLFDCLKGIRKYVLLVSILFTEFYVLDLLNKMLPNNTLGITGLFGVIAGFSYLELVVVFLWSLTAILWIVDVRVGKKFVSQKKCKMGRWIWGGVIVVVLVSIIAALYDVNIAGNTDKYGALKEYLLFSDEWGSGRGYIWRIAIESYSNFPLLHKLFGHGPDTFGAITVYNYYEDMAINIGGTVDSVHNEYLQYLVTIGIVGFFAYIAFFCSSIWHIVHVSIKNPVRMAIAFALICYGAQAIVNISVPIVSPIMMTLLMMGVSHVEKVSGSVENVS